MGTLRIGAAVLVRVLNPVAGLATSAGMPLHGRVAGILNGRLVNLSVIDFNGQASALANVPLRVGNEPAPGGEVYCELDDETANTAQANPVDSGLPTTGGTTPRDPSLDPSTGKPKAPPPAPAPAPKKAAAKKKAPAKKAPVKVVAKKAAAKKKR